MITAAAGTSYSAGDYAASFTLWSFIFIAYWVPTIVALSRKVPAKWQIAVVNFFAFTVVCWVIALVWALKPKPAPSVGY